MKNAVWYILAFNTILLFGLLVADLDMVNICSKEGVYKTVFGFGKEIKCEVAHK